MIYITEMYSLEVIDEHSARLYNKATEYVCRINAYNFDGKFTIGVVNESRLYSDETTVWLMDNMPLMEAVLGA